jgi:hypothetical protein
MTSFNFCVVTFSMMVALVTFDVCHAQGTDPIWLDELKDQIYQDQSCDANYFLNVHQYELAGDKVYEAKVQCVDGRQFDATRTGESAKFVIKACQPVVC